MSNVKEDFLVFPSKKMEELYAELNEDAIKAKYIKYSPDKLVRGQLGKIGKGNMIEYVLLSDRFLNRSDSVVDGYFYILRTPTLYCESFDRKIGEWREDYKVLEMENIDEAKALERYNIFLRVWEDVERMNNSMEEYNIDYSQEVIIQLLKLEGSCFSNIDNEFLKVPGNIFREYSKSRIVNDIIIKNIESLAVTDDGKELLDAIISINICENIFRSIIITPSIESTNSKIIQSLSLWKEKYNKKKLYIDFTFFEKVKKRGIM